MTGSHSRFPNARGSTTPLAQILSGATRVVQSVLAGRSLEAAMAAESLTGWDMRARASLRDYVSGTLREWRVLQSLVHWSAGRTMFTPNVLEPLLAVSLYGLRGTRVPPHTVVSQAVDASVALAGAQTKGLVNAVLRGYQRREEEFRNRLAHEPDAVRMSYPDWWVERLAADWPQDASAILRAGNVKAPMALRVNPKKITRDLWLAQATEFAITGTPFGAYGVLLATPVPTAQLPGFGDGQVSVQDAGAQIVADAMPLADGLRVLDACAAPGGKSAALLQRANIALTALDVDPLRQRTTKELLRRLELRADVRVGDAGDTASWWDSKPFDRIVLDAPCTASGVIRRHPDGKWLKRASDLASLTQEQARLLDALWPTLAPGGILLYVTCSVFRDENERQIAQFLARHNDASQQTVVWPAGLDVKGGGQLLPAGAPSTHNHDGFFCAALSKTL
jgi:16S rRNA (cytosine967-C5)-methyltransferase